MWLHALPQQAACMQSTGLETKYNRCNTQMAECLPPSPHGGSCLDIYLPAGRFSRGMGGRGCTWFPGVMTDA
jgi:hypothetical protein